MKRFACLLLVLLACDASDPPADGSTGNTPSMHGDGTTTIIAPLTSSSSSTAAEDPGFTPAFRMCRRTCAFAGDCCPADVEACPSPEYPGNVGCVDGLCVPATCTEDAQCNVQTVGATCEIVEGIAQCVLLCEAGSTCADLGSGFACGGSTEDGQGYCRERCELGTPCLLDTCNSQGVCECENDAQCVGGFACDPS